MTLYDSLDEPTRAAYPLASLDAKMAGLLATEIPNGYPKERIQWLLKQVAPVIPKATKQAVAHKTVTGLMAEAGNPFAPPKPMQGPLTINEELAAQTPSLGPTSPAGAEAISRHAAGEIAPTDPRAFPNRNVVERTFEQAGQAAFPLAARAGNAAIDVLNKVALPVGVADVPKLDPRARFVPPPQGVAEEAGSLAGGVAAFGIPVAAGAAVGLPPTASLGLAGWLNEPQDERQLAAAVSTMLAGKGAAVVGARLAPALAAVAESGAPGRLATFVAGHLPGSVAFGALEPDVRRHVTDYLSAIHLAAANEGSEPDAKERLASSAKLLVAALVGGAVSGEMGRALAPEATPEGVVPPEVAAARASIPEHHPTLAPALEHILGKVPVEPIAAVGNGGEATGPVAPEGRSLPPAPAESTPKRDENVTAPVAEEAKPSGAYTVAPRGKRFVVVDPHGRERGVAEATAAESQEIADRLNEAKARPEKYATGDKVTAPSANPAKKAEREKQTVLGYTGELDPETGEKLVHISGGRKGFQIVPESDLGSQRGPRTAQPPRDPSVSNKKWLADLEGRVVDDPAHAFRAVNLAESVRKDILENGPDDNDARARLWRKASDRIELAERIRTRVVTEHLGEESLRYGRPREGAETLLEAKHVHAERLDTSPEAQSAYYDLTESGRIGTPDHARAALDFAADVLGGDVKSVAEHWDEVGQAIQMVRDAEDHRAAGLEDEHYFGMADAARDALDSFDGKRWSDLQEDLALAMDPNGLAAAADVDEVPFSKLNASRVAGVPPAPRATTRKVGERQGDVPIPEPGPDLPKGKLPEMRVPGTLGKPAGPRVLAKVTDAFRESIDAVVRAVNPASLATKNAKGFFDIFSEEKGFRDRALDRTERAQEAWSGFWDNQSNGAALDFMNRMEQGGQHDPRLEEYARGLRERLDNVWSAIAHYKGVPYWENYFPHLWKNPDAKSLWLISSRRPLEGSKRFLKGRIYDDVMAGLNAGLEPRSWNPERLVQAVEDDARKFLLVQHLIERGKKGKEIVRAPIGVKPGDVDKQGNTVIPEGYVVPGGRWAQVYLNPVKEIPEYFDKAMREGLEQVAKNLGVKHERKIAIGMGAETMGVSKGGEVTTRFATPLSVLAHEIGHEIDRKFGMQADFLREPRAKGKGAGKANEKRIEMLRELRELADLRIEGQNASPSHKAYIRSAPEKMAVMIEALIHAPERFKDVAPKTYEKLRLFLGIRQETRQLLNLRPSLTYEMGTGQVHAGGAVLGGNYWMHADAARLLDRYLSPDLVTSNPIGKGLMASRNLLNALELGLSAFHFTGISLLAFMNKMSVGLTKIDGSILNGKGAVDWQRLVEGFRDIAVSPAAPYTYWNQGAAFFKGDPEMVKIEHDLYTGGAKFRLSDEYRNYMVSGFLRNARAGNLKGTMKASAYAIPALIEMVPHLIGTHFVPQIKVAAFRDVFAAELERREADMKAGKFTRAEIAREVYNNIDNRFGQLNYDNLFWDNTFKSALMIAVRAPGWTIGTLRDLGGAVFLDLPQQAVGLAHGERPRLTPKQGFTLAMIAVTLGVGGVYHYLHTGRRPETLEDCLKPQNGLKDGHGKPMRTTLPTYAKDVEGWSEDPVKEAVGRIKNRNGTSTLFHGGKLSSVIARTMDLLENQTYRGPIYKPNAPLRKKAADVAKWWFGSEYPFSAQNVVEVARGHGTTREKVQLGAEQFFGFTPAHKSAHKHVGGTR